MFVKEKSIQNMSSEMVCFKHIQIFHKNPDLLEVIYLFKEKMCSHTFISNMNSEKDHYSLEENAAHIFQI